MDTDALAPDRFALFAATRERVAGGLQRVLARELPSIADDLDRAAARPAFARQTAALTEAAAVLRSEASARALSAALAFGERALRCMELAGPAGEADAPNAESMRLLEESELAAQILVGDLAGRIRLQGGVAYADYCARVATLCGRWWRDDDLQPLGARTVAHAVTLAFEGVGTLPETRAALRASVLERLAAPLRMVIAQADEALRQAGVVPMATPAEPESPAEAASAAPVPVAAVTARDAAAASATTGTPPDPTAATLPATVPVRGAPEPEPVASVVPVASVAGPDASSPDATAASGATADAADTDPATVTSDAVAEAAGGPSAVDYLSDALEVVRRLGSSPFAVDAGGRLGRLPTLHPVADLERDAVAFAHSVGALPYSREARHALFGNVRARLAADGATPPQLALVDVVGAMFDYVVDDRRLPEASKPLVWRLQQPVIALTMLDPGYVGDEQRSLRRLVEHFGAIAMAYADDMVRGGELYRRLETVVRAVEIVASALQVRSAVMSRQVVHEYDRASRSVVQLVERVVHERQALEATPGRRNRRDYRRRPGKAREREVSEQLRALLDERLSQHEVSESMREFVLDVWMRRLRTALLRDGEDSREFGEALKVVDDLLWTVGGRGQRQSRRELVNRIPPLVRMLTDGLREIGAKDDEAKAFFDELFLVHLRKLQPRKERDEARAAEVPVLSEAVTMVEAATTDAAAAGGAATDVAREPSPVPPRAGPATHMGAATRKEPATRTARPTRTGPATRVAEGEGAAATAPEQDSELAVAGDPPEHVPQPAEGIAPSPRVIEAVESVVRAGDAPREGPEQRLVRVLDAVDLSDAPSDPVARTLSPEQAVAALERGDWLSLTAVDGRTALAKVAWLNDRRSVVLLVRHPDRKAVSLRMGELQQRFTAGRARLLVR